MFYNIKMMMMCAAASFAFMLSAAAEEETGKQTALDPKADKIIKDFCSDISNCKSVKVDISSMLKIKAEGMNQEISTDSVFSFQRPDKVAYIIKKGIMGASVVCDGKNVWTFVPSLNKYSVEPVPDKITSIGSLSQTGQASGFPIVQVLISDKPYESIMEGVLTSSYVGVEKIGDKECHHLKFTQAEFDWDIWLDTGDKPAIRKINPDFSKSLARAKEAGAQTDAMKNMNFDISLSFDNWSFDSDISDQFVFNPPPGAEKTDSLMPRQQMPSEEEYPLLGESAPVFKLENMEGGEYDLSEFIESKVIVLDFWAAWHQPSRKMLPMIVELTDAYKDKGVVFCAVNQKDDNVKIKEFLSSQNIKCPVALDKNSDVGKMYMVNGIPQTVVIGMDGKIHAVHLGFLPNLKTRLKKEIDTLLDGKSLLEEEKE